MNLEEGPLALFGIKAGEGVKELTVAEVTQGLARAGVGFVLNLKAVLIKESDDLIHLFRGHRAGRSEGSDFQWKFVEPCFLLREGMKLAIQEESLGGDDWWAEGVNGSTRIEATGRIGAPGLREKDHHQKEKGKAGPDDPANMARVKDAGG